MCALAARLALTVCLAASCIAADAEYEITSYSVTLDLIDNSPDIEVTLGIVYLIHSGIKTDGFKYVGKFRPESIQALDESGQAIRAGIRKERDYQVYWSFAPAGPGSKTVSVRFRLKNVLKGQRGGENRIEAPWLGQFRVPVRNASITVLFPPGSEPAVSSAQPETLELTRLGGRVALVAEESPLRHTGLSFSFSPGIADGASRAGGSAAVAPLLVGGGVLAFLVLLTLWRRTASQGPDGSSGDSTYVAGCGGGCGGGGCGGGGCGG